MAWKFIKDEEGQGLIEYMLILSLAVIVVIIALTLFGVNLNNYYNKIDGDVSSVLNK